MWVILIISLVLAVASLIVTLVTIPSVEDPNKGLQTFDYPTVEEGKEIPVIFGTVELTSPNIVWYGDISHYSQPDKPDVVYYHVGVQYVLCLGPVDRLKHVLCDKDLVWRDPSYHSTAANGQAVIQYDGERRKIWAGLDVYQGEPTQGPLVYPGNFCADMGNARGVLTVVIGSPIQIKIDGRGTHKELDSDGNLVTVPNADTYVTQPGYIGTQAQLGAWSFTATRIQTRQDGLTQWYPTAAEAGSDEGDPDYAHMNPAHILRECLTDPDWGLGYADSDIDDDSFTTAADTLLDESFGMSLTWSRQTALEDFVSMILQHINGMLYVSRDTGKFVIKLIREDYDTDSMTLFDPSNILKAPEVAQSSVGDLVNSVTVQYTYRGKDASVTVQDTALVQLQGGVIDHTVQYQGIQSREVASRVAARDLRAMAVPRINCTITVNQDGRHLNIGDAFLFSWPDYFIERKVMRVTGLNLGSGSSNTIRITATEDVFTAPVHGSVTDPGQAWVPPGTPPEPAANRLVTEIPYQLLAKRLGQSNADLSLGVKPALSYVVAAATRPGSANTAKYAVDADDSMGYQLGVGAFGFCPTATLVADVNKIVNQFVVENGVDLHLLQVNTVVQVNDELMRVTSYNVNTGVLTVGRGVLDTVPADHSLGARLYFWGSAYYFDQTERQDTDPDVSVKILPQTSLGLLSLDDAPVDIVDLNKRPIRPYPPARLEWNGVPFPATLTDPLNLTWVHRDRKQQVNGQILDTNDDSVGPEAGTTYTLRVKDNSGTVVQTWSGLTGTSKMLDLFDLPTSTATVELGSVRDGITSWQDHSHTFTFTRGDRFIVLPLLYDEEDNNGWLNWVRQGYAPNIMPSLTNADLTDVDGFPQGTSIFTDDFPGGFMGDGIRGRLLATSIPGWLSPASRALALHASVRLFDSYAPVSGGDTIIHLGANAAGTSPHPKLALKAIPDPVLTTRPYLALQTYTSALQTMPLARPDWAFRLRFPGLVKSGNRIQPRGVAVFTDGSYLICGHFNSTETLVYKYDSEDNQTGWFTFGTTTDKTIGGIGINAAGEAWFTAYDIGHTLKVNLAGSLSLNTAVLSVNWDTSVIAARGIAFYAVSGTEYVLLAEYKTSGTAYLYSVPTTAMSGTFAVTDRFKRWDIGLNVTGICIDSLGKLIATRTDTEGTVEDYGSMSTIHAGSADGATLTATDVYPAPSLRSHGIAALASGAYMVVTDGWSTAADRDGWASVWQGLLTIPATNNVVATYDGAGSLAVMLNGKDFETQTWTPTVDVAAIAIGGPPQSTEGFTNGFFKGLVSRVRLQDHALSTDDIDATEDATFIPRQLTTYSRTIGGLTSIESTSDWTNEVGAIATKNTSPEPYSGGVYLSGGSNAQTIARQRFSLTSFFGVTQHAGSLTTADIDTGALWANISWMQASLGAEDPCSLGLRFLDVAGVNQLSETYGLLDSVPGGDGGTTPNWHRLALTVPVPAGARWVDVLYKSTRTSGTTNDGYVDDLSVVTIFKK